MKLTKALLMAIILVLGGLYIRKFEMSPNGGAALQDSSRLLAEFDPDAVSTLTVTAGDSSYIVDLSAGGEGKLRDPKDAPVDPLELKVVLDTLHNLRIRNEIADEAKNTDTSLFGFDHPELIISYLSRGTESTVQFGSKHAFSGRRYVRIKDRPGVYLVDDYSFAQLNKTKDTIRNHNPVKFDPRAIEKIIAKRQDGTELQFERGRQAAGKLPDAPTWFVSSSTSGSLAAANGKKILADADMLERNLRALSNLKVKGFEDAPSSDLAVYGLNEPRLKLELIPEEAAKEKTITLLYGEGKSPAEKSPSLAEKDLPVVNNFLQIFGLPQIYSLGRINSDFLQNGDFFRGKSPFRELALTEIESITLHRYYNPPGGLTLIRSKENPTEWTFESFDKGAAVKADAEKISEWIKQLVEVKVVSYIGFDREKPLALNLDKKVFDVEILTKSNGSFKLLIANEVETSEPTAPPAEGNNTVAPRYGAIRGADQLLVPAIFNGGIARRLDRSEDFFAVKTSPATPK